MHYAFGHSLADTIKSIETLFYEANVVVKAEQKKVSTS